MSTYLIHYYNKEIKNKIKCDQYRLFMKIYLIYRKKKLNYNLKPHMFDLTTKCRNSFI